MELTRLTRQRATDEVYQALRQSILGHLFIPGERLQVEEIATKLGVSLTPVRHAIQQLATEGLIEIRPRSGTFVAKLTTRDLEETSDIRCALECLAAETAVRLATTHQISQLRSLAARIGTPVHSAEDRERHEADNLSFHRLLIECSANKRLAEMYESLNAHLQIARVHAQESYWEARLDVERAEHEAIVSALEARDLPALVDSLRTHILRARKSLAAGLGQ
jgi:DNA-binding GntR family transcriptional regulator